MSNLPKDLTTAAADLAIEFYTAKLGTSSDNYRLKLATCQAIQELGAFAQDKFDQQPNDLSCQEKQVFAALRKKLSEVSSWTDDQASMLTFGLWRFTRSFSVPMGRKLHVSKDGTFVWSVPIPFSIPVLVTGKFGDTVTVDDTTVSTNVPLVCMSPMGNPESSKRSLVEHFIAMGQTARSLHGKYRTIYGTGLTYGNPFPQPTFSPYIGSKPSVLDQTDVFVTPAGLELIGKISDAVETMSREATLTVDSFYDSVHAHLYKNGYICCPLATPGHEPRLGYRGKDNVAYPADTIWELAQSAFESKQPTLNTPSSSFGKWGGAR